MISLCYRVLSRPFNGNYRVSVLTERSVGAGHDQPSCFLRRAARIIFKTAAFACFGSACQCVAMRAKSSGNAPEFAPPFAEMVVSSEDCGVAVDPPGLLVACMLQ
jgi:hypothetical protein